MKVIILNKANYKEKDCIYDAISENEYFSFQAKRAQDSKSPYVWLNNPLTVADIELFEDGRYKHKLLKSAALVSTPLNNNDNLDYFLAMSTLLELTRTALEDNERHLMFSELLNAMDALRGGKEPLLVVLIYIARIIKISGIDLDVDKCVHCGDTTDIVAFSFNEGGFICRKHATEEIQRDLSLRQMKLIRYIFKIKDYSCVKSEEYERADKICLLNKLNEFINDYLGVSLKSIKVLLK